MIRKVITSILLLLSATTGFTQESSLTIKLPMGKYGVGFKVRHTFDYTRSFSLNTSTKIKDGKTIFRPMQVCVWYPVQPSQKSDNIKYEDYFLLEFSETGNTVLTEETKNEFIDNFIKIESVDPKNIENEVEVKMNAILNAKELSEKFPTIIYSPSWSSSSFENELLFEFLASHGYVIISSPSIGPYTSEMPLTQVGVETQARDAEFLISEIRNFSSADIDKLTLMGFSFGGLSNVFTLARNQSIDAWIGLDPSIHEDYDMFDQSPYKDYSLISAPSLFLNSAGFSDFVPYYENLVYSDAYMVNFSKIEHADMASQFIKLYGDQTSRSKSNMQTRNEAYNYMCAYILTFLEGVFRNNLDFHMMQESMIKIGGNSSDFLNVMSKKALVKPIELLSTKKAKLITYLNSDSTYQKYPQKDIERSIVFLYSNNSKQEAIELMKWAMETYKLDFEPVIEIIGIEEMVHMFSKVFATNDESCTFDYYQLNHTAQLFSMGNEKNEAIKYFQLNTKLHPESYQAQFNLGIGYFRLSDFDKAKKHFINCLNLSPDPKFFNLANEYINKCK